ncbi:hypothetical protein FNQ90_24235 [Streptomyces alkaliphilus]|uniref:Uncharacterized protein n=1 Tax=Streptomyces alkaliphilus TaxID=1472722 RepID=A0A7W3Y3S8_9ACTN|nr:hypothetical protein [Streptomyces alkaliphilus]MBB0247149.1 hypothetical protein [Streptomyces alkaliphilus]
MNGDEQLLRLRPGLLALTTATPIPARFHSPALYAAVMTLNADEYELLRLIAQSPEPVAASDFFQTIHPANFERSAAEEDPRRVAWQKKQLGLYKAVIDLHDGNLIRIVHPANGERPDLVEATEAGHAALT